MSRTTTASPVPLAGTDLRPSAQPVGYIQLGSLLVVALLVAWRLHRKTH